MMIIFRRSPSLRTSSLDVYVHFASTNVSPELYGIADGADDDGNACVEFHFTGEMTKRVLDDPSMSDFNVAVTRVLLSEPRTPPSSVNRTPWRRRNFGNTRRMSRLRSWRSL